MANLTTTATYSVIEVYQSTGPFGRQEKVTTTTTVPADASFFTIAAITASDNAGWAVFSTAITSTLTLSATLSTITLPLTPPPPTSSSIVTVSPSSSSSRTSSPPVRHSSSPTPGMSPRDKLGLGLGLGLGAPLLCIIVGFVYFLSYRRRGRRTTPVPDFEPSFGDAEKHAENPPEYKTIMGPAIQSPPANGERHGICPPELHGQHIPPYPRELPGSPGSRRNELP